MKLINESTIEPKEVEWLWYSFIPKGKVTISSVEGALRKLVDSGELKREGSGKSTYYIRVN